MVKLLQQPDLARISRHNIISIILGGITVLENKVLENSAAAALKTGTKENIRIHLINLMNLLDILVKECQHEPMTGILLVESRSFITFLKKIQYQDDKLFSQLFSEQSKLPKQIALTAKTVVLHLEEWKNSIAKKMQLPRGNEHLKDCYHPNHYATYAHLPPSLDQEHKTNFFFEVKIKELCPFMTLIPSHPYTAAQAEPLAGRPFEALSHVDTDVNLTDMFAVEDTDNIRMMRVHGPSDNKEYPGSFLVVLGGNHRLRELYCRYLEGTVDGETKILVQLANRADFAKGYKHLVSEEIARRQKIRDAFSKLKL